MSKKKKQIQSSQLLTAEKKRQQERINKVVREEIYPFLEKHTMSIKEAKNVCYVLDTVIQSEAMKRVARLPVTDFELFNEKDSLEKKLFEFLKNELAGDASAILRGILREIEHFQAREELVRKLTDLNIGKKVEEVKK